MSMLKRTKKQALTNLFIFSTSREKLNSRINCLVFEARQAAFERDYKKVVLAADELLALSSQSEPLGRYFQALALSQQGKGNRIFANEIFKDLAEENTTQIKAASLLALGVSAYQEEDFQEAERYIKIADEHCMRAPLTSVLCRTLQASIYSAVGKYEESILTYQKAMPRIVFYSKILPNFVNAEMNNLAYDLSQMGRNLEAAQIIEKVVASPGVSAYPEWLETQKEIQHKLKGENSQLFESIKQSECATVDSAFQRHRQNFRKNSSFLILSIYLSRVIYERVSLFNCQQVIDYYLSEIKKIADNSGTILVESLQGEDLISADRIAPEDLSSFDKAIERVKDIGSHGTIINQWAG